eukprot:Hpha_TRINITY_DN26381_c0_g1::TRINITY_DN26381_c0_g1_i1::g.9466::m.9466
MLLPSRISVRSPRTSGRARARAMTPWSFILQNPRSSSHRRGWAAHRRAIWSIQPSPRSFPCRFNAVIGALLKALHNFSTPKADTSLPCRCRRSRTGKPAERPTVSSRKGQRMSMDASPSPHFSILSIASLRRPRSAAVRLCISTRPWSRKRRRTRVSRISSSCCSLPRQRRNAEFTSPGRGAKRQFLSKDNCASPGASASPSPSSWGDGSGPSASVSASLVCSLPIPSASPPSVPNHVVTLRRMPAALWRSSEMAELGRSCLVAKGIREAGLWEAVLRGREKGSSGVIHRSWAPRQAERLGGSGICSTEHRADTSPGCSSSVGRSCASNSLALRRCSCTLEARALGGSGTRNELGIVLQSFSFLFRSIKY